MRRPRPGKHTSVSKKCFLNLDVKWYFGDHLKSCLDQHVTAGLTIWAFLVNFGATFSYGSSWHRLYQPCA